jgi:hypothetical protein
LLTAPFVVRSGAGAYGTKVKAQSDKSTINKSSSGAENYFVMHRSAAQRMRMANECHTPDCTVFWFFNNRFKLSVRRSD